MENNFQTDILAFGAHPDDVELGCSGTLLKHISKGRIVVVADLTRGELGTRGTVEDRKSESEKSSGIMGIKQRIQLGLKDGFFTEDGKDLLAVIKVIREFKPKVILANAPKDRHPDHGRAAELVRNAAYYSGLVKIVTQDENGKNQEPWRPNAVYHYIQDWYLKPDFVTDISEFVSQKFECIRAYASQFYDVNSIEPETPISSKEFLEVIDARMKDFGRIINCKYAEGFIASRTPGIEDLFDLV